MGLIRRARWITAAYFVVFSVFTGLFLTGCGREEIAADMDPPPVVQFTARSADTVLIEQGIDAVPDGDYIYLNWLLSQADDVAGYRLYRQAEDTTARQQIADLEGDATEYEDRDTVLAPDPETGLSTGFYYWITAYDESGNESALSDQEKAYFRLMAKPNPNPPTVWSDSLRLSWSYMLDDPFEVDYYVLRLLHLVDGQWTPFWLETYQEYSQLSTYYYGSLSSGTYRLKVDVVGATPADLPSGSESWLEFDVP